MTDSTLAMRATTAITVTVFVLIPPARPFVGLIPLWWLAGIGWVVTQDAAVFDDVWPSFAPNANTPGWLISAWVLAWPVLGFAVLIEVFKKTREGQTK